MGRARKNPDTTTFSGRVAERVRMLREKSGKTIEEFRDTLKLHGADVALSALYAYENGDRTIPPDLYPTLAAAFGLSVRQFVPKD